MDEEPSIHRRLVAILAADVAGYSRLMHEGERIHSVLLPCYVRDHVVIRPTAVRLGDFTCGST